MLVLFPSGFFGQLIKFKNLIVWRIFKKYERNTEVFQVYLWTIHGCVYGTTGSWQDSLSAFMTSRFSRHFRGNIGWTLVIHRLLSGFLCLPFPHECTSCVSFSYNILNFCYSSICHRIEYKFSTPPQTAVLSQRESILVTSDFLTAWTRTYLWTTCSQPSSNLAAVCVLRVTMCY